MVAILVVRFDNGVQILEACLIAPYFIIKEIHFTRTSYLGSSIAGDGIHHQTLVRMLLFHGFDERGISLRQIYLIAIIVIAVTPVSQLVYLITVKVQIGINIIVFLGNICLPFRIGGIEQEDITFPTGGQVMRILIHASRVLEYVPFFLYSVGNGIVQSSET